MTAFTFHNTDQTLTTLELDYPDVASLSAFLSGQGATWISDGVTAVQMANVASITTTDSDTVPPPAVEGADDETDPAIDAQATTAPEPGA